MPLGPDVVILHGGASCDEPTEGSRMRAIIECKNREYEYWAWDVESQLTPYGEIFQPDAVVLASMKKIPDVAKSSLRGRGYTLGELMGSNYAVLAVGLSTCTPQRTVYVLSSYTCDAFTQVPLCKIWGFRVLRRGRYMSKLSGCYRRGRSLTVYFPWWTESVLVK